MRSRWGTALRQLGYASAQQTDSLEATAIYSVPNRSVPRSSFREQSAQPFTMIRPRSLLRSASWPGWPDYYVERCCYDLLPPEQSQPSSSWARTLAWGAFWASLTGLGLLGGVFVYHAGGKEAWHLLQILMTAWELT